MYMEELGKYLRAQAGEESPQDAPIEGDIADDRDLGIQLEIVN